MLSDLAILAILLGTGLSAFFLFFLLGHKLKSHPDPVREGEPQVTRPLLRGCAGAFCLLSGLLMMGTIVCSVIQGKASVLAQISDASIQVILMGISSIALSLTGIFMIRGWHRSAEIFSYTIGLLTFSILVSLGEYGAGAPPAFMIGVTLLISILIVYFVGLTYAYEHFMFRLDTSRERTHKS